VRRNKKYHAHDEKEEASVGDLVEIVGTRPLSKLKRWRLVRVVEAAPERGVEVSESATVELLEAAEAADTGGAA
jgi:hypothetical protein